MFLTHAELCELTEFTRPSDQRRWLQRHRYPHAVTARGRPRVLRSYVEQRLSGLGGAKAIAIAPRAMPNLAAVKR